METHLPNHVHPGGVKEQDLKSLSTTDSRVIIVLLWGKTQNNHTGYSLRMMLTARQSSSNLVTTEFPDCQTDFAVS